MMQEILGERLWVGEFIYVVDERFIRRVLTIVLGGEVDGKGDNGYKGDIGDIIKGSH